MNDDISILITYCTLDDAFLDKCTQEALKITNNVYVFAFDKFFDGTPQDSAKLNRITMGDYKGVIFNFDMYKSTSNVRAANENKLRRLAWEYIQKNKPTKYTLLLDVDEIVDANKFIEWYNTKNSELFSYFFESYWYFRDYDYRALVTESHCIPLVLNSRVNPEEDFTLAGMRERWAFKKNSCMTGIKLYGIVPMFHHYSWVRTKEEMLKKVSVWSHKDDKDWNSLIEEEYSRPFNFSDFVHGYKFEKIANVHGFKSLENS